MFAADVVVTQQTGLLDGIFNDFFHPRAERNFTECHRGAAAGKVALDLKSHLLRRQAHLLDDH